MALFGNTIFGCVLLAYVVGNSESISVQSNRYPADIHPSACPHYPYCENAALALSAIPAHHGEHLLGYAAQPSHPADVNPHSCPNYPYCSQQIPHEAIHYKRSYPTGAVHRPHEYAASSSVNAYYVQPVSVHNRYPAGVSPASCPNYPYCH